VVMVKSERTGEVQEKAEHLAEERILDILIPSVRKTKTDANAAAESPSDEELNEKTRERFREKIKAGQLDDRIIELDVPSDQFPAMQILGPMNLEEIGVNLQDVFGNLMPKKMKKRKLSIADAKKILVQEEAQKLIDQDAAVKDAIHRVENSGIVFLDEVDKIAGNRGATSGPDVSTVATKYGMVRTDHVLFIASGAFHVSKPSDLIPELQGRFPIRVELKSLTEEDFVKILTLPQNALIKQYTALLKTDGIEIEFTDDAIRAIARIATQVNEEVENIGARRLHTIMTSLLEEILFEAPEKVSATKLAITKKMVEEKLNTIVKDKDLSRFIL
jgi:ATP-dependent HslUV protease ATP-binding subunit HslU